jgi:hypothetical protein
MRCEGLKRRIETLKWNTQNSQTRAVNGMKRYVCVDQPDESLPAARHRAVFWHASGISARQTDAASCYINSKFNTHPDRSPPRAHTQTHDLSLRSPAISASFQSVSSCIHARHELVCRYLN